MIKLLCGQRATGDLCVPEIRRRRFPAALCLLPLVACGVYTQIRCSYEKTTRTYRKCPLTLDCVLLLMMHLADALTARRTPTKHRAIGAEFQSSRRHIYGCILLPLLRQFHSRLAESKQRR